MRNAIKLAISLGSVASMLSGAVLAQQAGGNEPIQFGSSFTVDGSGNVTPNGTCPVNACGTPTAGNGFMQRQITAADGTNYIQTVVVGFNAQTGAEEFRSEDFIKLSPQGSAGQQSTGIASQSSIFNGPITAPTFLSGATIRTGWALADATLSSQADLTFGLSEGTGPAAFTTNFNTTVVSRLDAATGAIVNTTNLVAINQSVGLGSANDPNSANDKQVFRTVIRPARAVSPAAYTLTPGGTGTATWQAGEDIRLVWIAQGITNVGGFQTTSVANVEPGAAGNNSITQYTNLNGTTAPTWDNTLQTEFDDAPTF